MAVFLKLSIHTGSQQTATAADAHAGQLFIAQLGNALNCRGTVGGCRCLCCCRCCCCSRSCCCTSLSARIAFSPSTNPAALSALGVYTHTRSSGVRLASQSHTCRNTASHDCKPECCNMCALGCTSASPQLRVHCFHCRNIATMYNAGAFWS